MQPTVSTGKTCCKSREVHNVLNPEAAGKVNEVQCRHACGCLRTSEKLTKILETFPPTPPPSTYPIALNTSPVYQPSCVTKVVDQKTSAGCVLETYKPLPQDYSESYKPLPQPYSESYKPLPQSYSESTSPFRSGGKNGCKSWQMVGDLMQLVQLSVTATALALYYLIYCYMQLVYFTLKSAMYFHQADGPMKITIGVVTLTSILIGFNIALRMERMFEIFS